MPTPTKPFRYGGQAVYEGVMIRGQKHLAMAVRASGGNVEVDTRPLPNLYLGKLRRTAFVRGTIVMLETLIIGTQELMRSANMALGEEEKIPSGLVWGTGGGGLILCVGPFFVAPLFVTGVVLFPFTRPLVGNILEGLLR